MLELIGSAELWQWDTGRQVDCAGLPTGAKVQFAYGDTQTLSTAVKTVGGTNVADVPNQLLLRSGALMAYAYVAEADGVSYTKYAARLNVQARPKPDDYVYTPTEVQSWQTIRDEIGDLSDLETEAKNTLVAAINEAANSGGGGGDGGYLWRPTVSAAGEISWERSKSTTAPAAESIKGPKGDQGAKGDTGAKGETGAQGPKGDPGTPGDTFANKAVLEQITGIVTNPKLANDPYDVLSWQAALQAFLNIINLGIQNPVTGIYPRVASVNGDGMAVWEAADKNALKKDVVSALGYTPADAPGALICTISGAGTDASPYACDKTTAEIDAAIQAGKTVQAKLEGLYYPLVARTSVQSCAFAGAYKASSTVRTIIVTQNGTVMVRSTNMENAANKTTDLSASSTDTQYPSAKAVWDSIPHPEAKTDAMTQAVGKDADGKLWTAPGGGSGGGFAPTLVASLTADGTTTSILQNIDIAYPAIYTVSIHAKNIADTDNAGQTIFALFGGKTQFEQGVNVRSIKTASNTFTVQLVALTFALDAEKKIRTIGKAENNADNLTSWDNYAEGGTLTSNAILLYSSTNKIIPAGFKCDVWRWM